VLDRVAEVEPDGDRRGRSVAGAARVRKQELRPGRVQAASSSSSAARLARADENPTNLLRVDQNIEP
jgi:hypothetical protein